MQGLVQQFLAPAGADGMKAKRKAGSLEGGEGLNGGEAFARHRPLKRQRQSLQFQRNAFEVHGLDWVV